MLCGASLSSMWRVNFFLYPCILLLGVLLFPTIPRYYDATSPGILGTSRGPNRASVATFKAFASKYDIPRDSKTLIPIIVHISSQALPGSCRLSPEALPWKPPHTQTFCPGRYLYPGRTRACSNNAFSAVQDSNTATVILPAQFSSTDAFLLSLHMLCKVPGVLLKG